MNGAIDKQKKKNAIIRELLNEVLYEGGPLARNSQVPSPGNSVSEGLTNIPPYQMPGGGTGQDYINQNLNVASPAETRGFIGAQQGNPDLDVELLIKILNEEVARRSLTRMDSEKQRAQEIELGYDRTHRTPETHPNFYSKRK